MMRRIRFYRLKAGLSQTELAEIAGVTQPMVSNWENGLEMDLEAAIRIYHALAKHTALPEVPITALRDFLATSVGS